MTPAPQMRRFTALGTECTVGVADPAASDVANRAVAREISICDQACSRFRSDSDLSRLNAAGGHWTTVSRRLVEDLLAARRAAELTDGIVDPTIGRALVMLGYDRDFSLLPRPGPTGEPGPVIRAMAPVPGWRAVEIHRTTNRVRLPEGILLDLGATAKARCADLAAAAAAQATGCGVLVNLGGDLAIAGPVPGDGWRVRVTHHSADPIDAPGQTVALAGGGLATSSVLARAWRHEGHTVHHLVDPRTGRDARVVWQTVSVTAATCLDANIASTAAIILGEDAPAWLSGRRLCARLVDGRDRVVTVCGWPADVGSPAGRALADSVTGPGLAVR